MSEGPAASIGLIAGAAALSAGAEPTGSPADPLLVVGGVVVVCWMAAWCPWWLLAAVALLAAVTVGSVAITAVAVAAFASAIVGALRSDVRKFSLPTSAGLTMLALFHSDLGGFFACSAVVGVVAATAIMVGGLIGQPPTARRPVLIAAGWLTGAGLLAVAAAGVAGASARDDLQSGTDATRRAVDALATGDYEGAAAAFEKAADDFDTGAAIVDGPFAVPSRLVPGVAQNTTAVRELAHAAAGAADDAATALRSIDPDALTLTAGQIDLLALSDAEQQMIFVADAIDRLETTTSGVSSPWLVEPLQRRVDELGDEIVENRPRIDTAAEALRLAPQLLGSDGPRRYLVLFTTPAEARGLGGFSGNFAVLSVDDGAVSVEEFGRSGDVNDQLAARRARCVDCPSEFLDAYGIYGFDSGPNGGVDPLVWLNITIGAHFPYVAETAANLYAEAGGLTIDGVVVMDPYVVAELMRITGPIAVEDLGVTVSADDVVDFLLVEQYVVGQEQQRRVEALETLGVAAMTRMLESSLPSPVDLAERFGPLIDERRLLLWTRSTDERVLLDEVGLLGALPPVDPSDSGFAVTVTNAAGNKIDSFLDTEVSVTESVPADGQRALTAEVMLTNGAPATGLPDYVIGNEIGLPVGTSRLIVTFYGPLDVITATADAEPIELAAFSEAGWFGHRHSIDLASGEQVRYRLVFPLEGTGDGSFDPARWTQPLRR